MTLDRLLVPCSALLLIVGCGKSRPGDLLTIGDAGESHSVAGVAPVAGQGTGGSGVSSAGGMAATPAGTSGGGSTAGGVRSDSGAAGTGVGDAGGADSGGVVQVWKSDGCGKPAQGGPGSIGTMGVKEPNCSAKLS